MKTTSLYGSDTIERLRTWLEEVQVVWGLKCLADEADIRISTRMTHALGNARPVEKRITLASWVMSRPHELIHEVLCHEAAHVAVYVLHGGGCRPHGPEWRELMKQAGFHPRTRIDVPNPPPPRTRRRASVFRRAARGFNIWMKK